MTSEDSQPMGFDQCVATKATQLWRAAWLLTADSHHAFEQLTEQCLQPTGPRRMRRGLGDSGEGGCGGSERRGKADAGQDRAQDEGSGRRTREKAEGEGKQKARRKAKGGPGIRTPPPSGLLTRYLPSALNRDFTKSRFSCEMDSSGMPLGQTAAHSPMLVQLPKPSSSCAATMDFTRR